MVLRVIPAKEEQAERARILDGTETIRELRPVLHGPELGFGEWVIIGDIGTRVSLGDAQITEQLSNQLGLHRRSPISMQGELALDDCLLGASVGDELPSQ